MTVLIAQQVALGLLAIVLGLSGWILPYRFSLLRLRWVFAAMVPERVSRAMPKVVGTVLVAAGVALLAGALLGDLG